MKIENYRIFSDFEIELKPFSLIIGENNIGKTNMLEALGLIFSQELSMMKKRSLEIDDINYKTLQVFKTQFSDEKIELKDIKFPEVKVEVTMTCFNEDQEAVVGDWFTNKELTEAKLTYLFRLREGWRKKDEWLIAQRGLAKEGKSIDFPIKEYEYYIFGGGESANKVDFYFLKMLKMELLDALRDAKRELTASGEYRLLYKILSNRDQSKFADIKEALNSLNEKLQGHNELKEIKKSIEEYLDKISLYEKEGDNSVSFRFSSPELAEILKKVGTVYGIDPVGVERNGLGRNNLLYISLILSHLTGESVGSNYTFFRLVGIEEPEAHLHPHLQSHLAKNIKGESRDDLQIILTSHSPYIASKLDIENTHILYREGNDIKAHNVLTHYQSSTGLPVGE
jgi:predicted ATP-dependent endonuclease of OLD family